MIIKASKVKSIRHAGMLAKHLLRTDDNEIAQVWAINGTARPDDLNASLQSMQRATELTRGKTGLFHVAINPREDEAAQMSEEQWARTLQAIEKEFGLAGQPCAIIEHKKNGRSHLHAVYQLTDTDKGKLIDVKNDHYRCQALGRQLEQEFDHAPTNNAPSRDTYNRDEQQQAKRLGESVTERRAGLREIYQQAQDGAQLRELLTAKGYTIARGDRAALVLVDAQGEVFGLTRELGIKAKDARQFLGGEIERIPTLAAVLASPPLDQQPDRPEPVQPIEGHDLDTAQDLAMAMIRHVSQAKPQEEKSFSFTINQVLRPPSEMLYSDLLSQQQAQLEKMNADFYEASQTIKKLQAGHYDANVYAGELDRLDAALKRDTDALKEKFELERQNFLGEAPALSNDTKPVEKPVPLDTVSEGQDKAVDLLAEFRRRPREKKQEDTADESLLKEFRRDPDDDLLSQFRRQNDEQTRKRSRGLGL